MKNAQRIIGFSNDHVTAAPRIKPLNENVLGGYTLKQWETAFKRYFPHVRKFVRFYLKMLWAMLILFLVGMGVTFGLTLVAELLPSLPEKMPYLFRLVEGTLVPYYERFFAICCESFSNIPS